jgi:DNA-binding NarL/FixJ family response regulator
MSSWGVQMVIGKLVTDEAFRQQFETRADESLAHLCERGIDLTEAEVAAFVETDADLWARVAQQIDPRLRSSRAPRVRAATPVMPRSLTKRERQVLHRVFDGCTNKQISIALGVSESAVKATLQHLFRKTQVRTRAQLVRVVVEGRSAM